MSEMKVGLIVRAEGKQAQRELQQTAEATQNLGRATRDVGKAAQTAGAQVKQAASAQAAAIRQAAAGTADALADVKRSGGAAGNAIKRGMQDGVREERRAGEEADRLGDRIKRMLRRVGDSGGVFRIMGRAVRNELSHIKSAIDSTMGKLAALGVGYKVGQQVVVSARLDRTMIRSRQTIGMTSAESADWRAELFRMGRENGNPVEALQSAFDRLGAAGLDYRAAKAGTQAIDRAMTVTGADPEVLAKALVTGASAFNFDLSRPGQAVELLDKMIVAGRLGNAELENLSSIFPRIGQRAASIKMPFEQTLAFAETLSNVEMEPERLGTLAESTLRLFGSRQYADQVTRATHVRFFNRDGSRRNVIDVFKDLRAQYLGLKDDNQRSRWLGKVLKGTDQDTQRGFGVFLSGNRLEKFLGNWQGIRNAGAVMDHDIGENRASATAVAGRVKNTFGEAMDRMAQPVNKAFAEVGTYLLDDLNLSGEQLIGGTFVAGLGAHSLGRFGKYGLGKISKWLDGGTDTLRNIAVGRALHDATGVMPVFVTNWSGAPSGGGGGSDPTGTVAKGWASWEIAKRYGMRLLSRLGPAAGVLAVAGGEFGEKEFHDRWVAERRAGIQKHYGLTDEQMDAFARVEQQMPLRSWAKAHRGQFADERSQAMAYSDWVANQAAKLDSPATGKSASPEQVQQVTAALDAARRAFESVLGKPLRIEVTSDTPELHAKVVQRAEREARRG